MKEKNWKTYEDVARYLLEKFSKEFNLTSVEGKQKIHGNRSGTPWAIEAKGIKDNNGGFMIIECK
ncbi:MAG: hypothetical protein ABH873_06350 [Candidatus Firestonebacteria bacterium]